MKLSKVLTAAVATASMLATGLVAVAPASATAMGETKFDANLNRDFDASTPVVVRPGESVDLSISFTIDERYSNPVITPVTDIAVGDVLTFDAGIVSSATFMSGNYSWYGTTEAGNGCYAPMAAMGYNASITWSADAEACALNYISVYRNYSYTNTTNADVSIAANPTLTSTGSTTEWFDTDAGVGVNMHATIRVSDVTSYTATSADNSMNFDISNICVANTLSAGDRFVAQLDVSNGSANLGDTSGNGAYVNPLNGRAYNGNYSTFLNDEIAIASYEIQSNRYLINTVAPHGLTGGTAVDIEGTGITELDAVDNTYLYRLDADTLYFYLSAADMAETAVNAGTVSFEGRTGFIYPDAANSIVVVGGSQIIDMVAGETYQMAVDVVRADDTSVSVSRPCGLDAPSFTVGTPTYNSVPVTITGVPGATSYQCRAQLNGTTVFTGYLSETNPSSPLGGICTISNLSASTTYAISVNAYSQLEGAGEWGSTTNATTPANPGGGGGGSPQVIGVLQALTGATSPNAAAAVTRTMHSSSVIAPTSRGYSGANGDILYAGISAGNLVVTRSLSTGADTRFAGTGSVVVPNVMNVSGVNWMGASGTSWVVRYLPASGGTGFKWGKNNTATGIKTQIVTTDHTAALCQAQFGVGYSGGYPTTVSSSIEAPLVQVTCMPTDASQPTKVVLATIKVASGSASPYTAITKLTNYSTVAAPCNSVSQGRNPAAKTATAAANVFVVTTYAKTNGFCNSGVNPTKREVITVSYAAKKLKALAATSTQIAPTAMFVSLAPGFAANTWVGITTNPGSGMAPSVPGHLFTIDSLARVTKKANVTFSTGASNASFSGYSNLSPLKAVSASTIVGVRIGGANAPGQSWAAATISLTTGRVTTGRVATVTGENYTGYQTGQNINLVAPTVDFKKLNFFTLSNVDTKQYKVVTWTQATR